MKKFKIDDTDWYQQQNWLDDLKEMSLRFGEEVLSQIGMKMLDYAPFPETTKDLETAIKQMDIIYHKVHRKNGKIIFDSNSGLMLEGIGHDYYCINGNEFTITNNSPYPCTVDKGIVTATAQKFNPNAIVIHDDTTSCRKRGDKFCTYKIRW